LTVVLDHLVVASPSLEAGVLWCEATFGFTPGPGGKHASMGTHNRLFRIASAAHEKAYLEIIAVDPDAPRPARARWFGLDAIDPAAGPRLIHWVARAPDLDVRLAALRAVAIDAGEAIGASRDTPAGLLQWRIAVRHDGRLLANGAIPTLIEWGDRHPSASMPASGASLRSLTVRGLPPMAAAALDLKGVDLAADIGPAITAVFDTPRGAVTLNSS
jgi:hypothetical protein